MVIAENGNWFGYVDILGQGAWANIKHIAGTSSINSCLNAGVGLLFVDVPNREQTNCNRCRSGGTIGIGNDKSVIPCGKSSNLNRYQIV